jgi:outer membrane protein assembly factor BamB
MSRKISFLIAIVLATHNLTSAAPASATQPVFDPSDCPAFHGGGPLVGTAQAMAAPPLKVRWTYRVPDEAEPATAPASNPSTHPATAPVHSGPASFEAGAAVVGDTVYVADSAGGLHALDLATGKQKWLYATENGFGTTPLVMGGRVFIGDLDGTFHCVSGVDGKKIWTFDGGSTIHSSANFAGADSIVFGDDGADIYCLRAADGKQLWQSHAGDRVNGSPAFADESVFVSGCDAQLRAIKVSDGTERWAVDIGALAPGSPAIAADRIVIGEDQGRVVCLPRAGGANAKPLWVFEGVGAQAMVYSSPAIADGLVVVGARDRNVWAIDLLTGKPKWSFPTRGDVDASPVISGGRVYAASKDKRLYVLDLHTGRQLWEFNAAKPITASPTVARGVVILCDAGGTVRCLAP